MQRAKDESFHLDLKASSPFIRDTILKQRMNVLAEVCKVSLIV